MRHRFQTLRVLSCSFLCPQITTTIMSSLWAVRRLILPFFLSRRKISYRLDSSHISAVDTNQPIMLDELAACFTGLQTMHLVLHYWGTVPHVDACCELLGSILRPFLAITSFKTTYMHHTEILPVKYPLGSPVQVELTQRFKTILSGQNRKIMLKVFVATKDSVRRGKLQAICGVHPCQ